MKVTEGQINGYMHSALLNSASFGVIGLSGSFEKTNAWAFGLEGPLDAHECSGPLSPQIHV